MTPEVFTKGPSAGQQGHPRIRSAPKTQNTEEEGVPAGVPKVKETDETPEEQRNHPRCTEALTQINGQRRWASDTPADRGRGRVGLHPL